LIQYLTAYVDFVVLKKHQIKGLNKNGKNFFLNQQMPYKIIHIKGIVLF